MREIEFRGRMANGRWVYGDYCRLFRGLKMNGNSYNHFIFENNKHCEVDPTTVGQYTGLRDRDGKEIYEGDILAGGQLHSTNGFSIDNEYGARVYFDGGMFKCGTISLVSIARKGRVIGNIHDNPEPIKA